MGLLPPEGSDDWLALTGDPLPAETARTWAELPSCGAVVLFTGTVRDHAGERTGVTWLEYEAYEEQVVARLAEIAAYARGRWPSLGRLALLHRTGRLRVGETAVVVAVSTPHRDEAFDAARASIDAVKSSVPIWKREAWSGGEDWAACDHPLAGVWPLAEVGRGRP